MYRLIKGNVTLYIKAPTDRAALAIAKIINYPTVEHRYKTVRAGRHILSFYERVL